MAFDKKIFQKRTTTAIVFGAVMLTGLLLNEWSFFLLVSIIHFGCWWEYLKIITKIQQCSFNRNVVTGLMLAGFSLLLAASDLSLNSLPLKNIYSSFLITGCIVFLFELVRSMPISPKAILLSAFGWVYISISLALMLDLYSTNEAFFFSNQIPLLIIISIWFNDSLAYLIGSWIGKTPLSKISPKKTWEGTIGGILLTILIIGIAGYSKLIDSSIHVLAIAILSTISGTFGDLFESKLKRLANVKDSGTFMPGHGGFLDRFDSLLFAIPTVWLYVAFFLK